MARVPHLDRKRKKFKIMGQPNVISQQGVAAMRVDGRLELIRTLVPLAVQDPDRVGRYCVRVPRAGDQQKDKDGISFSSKLLPPYFQRTQMASDI